jgi:hypothetical protein
MGGFKLYFPIDDEEELSSTEKPATPTTFTHSQKFDAPSLKILEDSSEHIQPATPDVCSNPNTELSRIAIPVPLRNPSWKTDQSEAVAHPMTPTKGTKTYREHTTEGNKRRALSIPSLEEEGEENDEPSQELNFRSYVGGRRRSSAQRSADYYAFMDGKSGSRV